MSMNENCLCVLVVTKTAKVSVSVSGVGLGLDPAGLGLGLCLGLPGLDNISAHTQFKPDNVAYQTLFHWIFDLRTARTSTQSTVTYERPCRNMFA